MSSALRDAVLSPDAQMCANGCQAILWFREYDLMAALINAAEDEANSNADQAAGALVDLAELLYQELASPRDYRQRRDPQLVRRHVVTSLESSIKRYPRHRRREIVEAFLLLAKRDNAVLKAVLHDPHDGSYLAIVDALTKSSRTGVRRLVLGFLEDPRAPSAAIAVLAHRADREFLDNLLAKIGPEPSDVAAQNLKRIEDIAWLRDDRAPLDELDEAAQHSLVQMVMASGMKRLEVFKTISRLMTSGTPAGRRAACAALAEFSGAEANALVVRALDDPDAEVQAHALVQLRHRGIPNAMPRLIEMVDSPHAVVRDAVRTQLDEFRLERYLAAFDTLDEEVRRSTGELILKIDPEALVRLVEEMSARARSRRLRAVGAAQAMGVADQLQQPLVELLADEDHMVRTEAARALSTCNTPAARDALQAALADRSVSVQLAARQSLERLGPTVLPGTLPHATEADSTP
jgi:HEAT repeat protein